MKLTLHRLTLRNFKGARDLTLDAAGADLSIWGDNAAGKTTIADAFFWLLFDKDSANRKDFEVKTLDPETGKPFQGLDHEVEAELQLPDGKSLTLRKVYRELWVRQRGAAESTFSGHSTDYFVNTVPVQKKEYDQRVREISDDVTFRLLTDPTYFAVVMPWADRRKALLKVCGDVSDAEVIASRKDLAPLPDLMGEHSLEDYRKIIAAKRREINEELAQLPARIDEATRSKADVGPAPEPDAAAKAMAVVQQLQDEQTRLRSGGEVAEQQKLLADVERRLTEAKTAAGSERNKKYEEIHARLRAKEQECTKAQADINSLGEARRSSIERKERLGYECDQLREQYRAEAAKNFEFTGEDTCAACGQALPAEKVDAARSKAEEEFNVRRSTKLESINAEGKTKKAEIENITQEIAKLDAALIQADELWIRLLEERDEIKAEGAAIEAQPVAEVTDESLLAEKAAIEARIAELRFGASDALSEIARKIEAAQAAVREIEAHALRVKEGERIEQRITELKERHKALNAEYEALGKGLFLTEEFIRAKVNLLEEKINERFKIARFKLFEQQVNGGLGECCEVTLHGVPYGSLNHGARLNVGLDIINTLAEHFAFAPPVVIDNAESVTKILPTVGQQIRLVVSAADKTLRIEKSAAQANPVLELAL